MTSEEIFKRVRGPLREAYPDRHALLLLSLERILPWDFGREIQGPRCSYCRRPQVRTRRLLSVRRLEGWCELNAVTERTPLPQVEVAAFGWNDLGSRPVGFLCAGCAAEAAEALLGPDEQLPSVERAMADIARALRAAERGRTEELVETLEKALAKRTAWTREPLAECSFCGTGGEVALGRPLLEVRVCAPCATRVRAMFSGIEPGPAE